jgi:putative pyoverdin transport system ATP-binding/permease protein
MPLLTFLWQSSRSMVTIALLTGFLSGSSSAALVALISLSLAGSMAPGTIAWGFIGLAIVTLVTDILARVVLIRLSQTAVFQLQLRLTRQILAAELSHLERLGSARLLATLTEDVQAISTAVFALPLICINLAIVAASLVYIVWLSWLVFLLVLALSLVAMASCSLLLRRGRKLLAQAREDQDDLFQQFRATTEGIKELKLNFQRRQDFLHQELQPTAQGYRRHSTEGLTLYAINESWGRLLLFFAIGLVLFVVPSLLRLDASTIAGFVLTFTYLMGPLTNLVSKLPLLSKAGIALQKIASLGLALGSYAEAETVPAPIAPAWQSLELRQVTHTYGSDRDDTRFTLGPIDLVLHPGELVFLIGGNGSGKSTLAKLITGLYSPEAGQIYWDGQPIDHENREGYRQQFSAVFADFYLFDRLLGVAKPDLEVAAQNYLKLLHLDRKVSLHQGQLSTIALSQGQRKRLALLTSYLEDRPIYLFDEWAADQDPVFKQIFYTQLLPQLRARGKTVLAITHDDQYFHLGDRLIKLDYGKIEFDRPQGQTLVS